MPSVRGLTLLEMLVVLGVMAILLAILPLALRPLYDPLEDAAARAEAYLRNARLRAMATTSAYRVEPSSNARGLRALRAPLCTSPVFWPDPSLVLDLPEGVRVRLQGPPPCFTSRGVLADPRSSEFILQDARGRTLTLRLLLAGGVMRP